LKTKEFFNHSFNLFLSSNHATRATQEPSVIAYVVTVIYRFNLVKATNLAFFFKMNLKGFISIFE